jgi:uncharacterized protein YfdQ (DUF2303 family)
MPESDPNLIERGDAAVVVETAIASAEPSAVEPGGLYSVTTPFGGASHQIVDLEKYLDAPTRARGTYRPSDVASFIDYVDNHKVEAMTTVWVHPTKGEVVAVINDNSADDSAWGDHRAVLSLLHSPEWELWAGARDGSLMSQEAFAEHLREGMPDIKTPDAATLIEIAENFEATTDVHFRSKVDFNSGAKKFKYDEESKATATTAADGEIEVPRQFILHLAPFMGEEPVAIAANLRHSTRSGRLEIGYKLERPERAVEEALQRVADRVSDKFTRVYRGTPA